MRLPWPAVAGGSLVVVLGAAGLIRGAVPQSAATDTPSDANTITVTAAYVRPPVPPTKLAAAYFTVRNNTGTDDKLIGVITGAGATAVLHSMGADGSMTVSATGAVVRAHKTLVLSAGSGHVMIGSLFGKLRAGDDVNIALQFQNAGPVDVVAPVIPFGKPAPTSSGDPK